MPTWFLERWLGCAVDPRNFGIWRNRPHWHTRRSYRHLYELYLVLDGSMSTIAAGRTLDLPTMTAAILPPGLPFDDRGGPQGTRLLGCLFAVQAGTAFDPLQTLGLPQAVALRRPLDIQRALKSLGPIENLLVMGEPSLRLRVRAFLDLLLGAWLADGFAAGTFACPAGEPMPDWLLEILALVESRLDWSLISVGGLARRAGLSESQFRRVFHRFLGISPKRWMLDRRLAEARNLLVGEPLLPVASVAERCGFADIYQFSRTFRRACGVPPTIWRQLAAEDAAGNPGSLAVSPPPPSTARHAGAPAPPGPRTDP